MTKKSYLQVLSSRRLQSLFRVINLGLIPFSSMASESLKRKIRSKKQGLVWIQSAIMTIHSVAIALLLRLFLYLHTLCIVWISVEAHSRAQILFLTGDEILFIFTKVIMVHLQNLLVVTFIPCCHLNEIFIYGLNLVY